MNADSAKLGAFETPCIIAAVIWYRQTPERLRRLVASLEYRCQGVVALDGPFAGLSDDASSPEDNYNAIADAADSIDLPYRVFEGRVWRAEPEKRTAAARAALALALELEPDAEPWVLWVDSDEWLLTDLDAEPVAANGHGSCQLQSYRDGEPVDEGGTGTRMVRLFPNSEHLIWGPAHFDVRDMSIPKTYLGWEKALVNDEEPAFTLGHDLGEKVIQAEYEAYNDRQRVLAEGKMLRTVEDYGRGHGRFVIRMDDEQIALSEWGVGTVIGVRNELIEREGEGNGSVVVRRIEPVEGNEGLLSDVICERVSDEEAEELARVQAEAMATRMVEQQASAMKRLRKRMRQQARASRMHS